MLRGQDGRITYVKQLPSDYCCEMVDELEQKMKTLDEWMWVLNDL